MTQTQSQGNKVVLKKSTLRSWSGLASLQTFIHRKSVEELKGWVAICQPQTLMTWRALQEEWDKILWDVCKPGGQLQETSDLWIDNKGFATKY